MGNRWTVFRYECLNALRSKWLFIYCLCLVCCSAGFSHLVEDSRKVELALVSIVGFLVPLVSILFSVTYWYNVERFTELLLSQPVSRKSLFWSRAAALSCSLIIFGALGLFLPFVIYDFSLNGVFTLGLALLFLSGVFSFLGCLIATFVSDKMWGVGAALSIWAYFELIHDGILLTILISFRDYPLDSFTALFCALNPVSLARVALLMSFDAPLLLGHAGALIRRLVEGNSGLIYSSIFAVFWVALPLYLARRKFLRRDF